MIQITLWKIVLKDNTFQNAVMQAVLWINTAFLSLFSSHCLHIFFLYCGISKASTTLLRKSIKFQHLHFSIQVVWMCISVYEGVLNQWSPKGNVCTPMGVQILSGTVRKMFCAVNKLNKTCVHFIFISFSFLISVFLLYNAHNIVVHLYI